MHPDPSAFHAADLAQWDGARTLPGIWIAHPMAETARRVRLTNGETGARVDAAMFRRDPNLSGPRIIVSSEAAERLGLTPGHGTPITIEGLAYRVAAEATAETEAVAAGAAEKPVPAPVEVPAAEVLAQEIEAEPTELELTPVAALSPAPPAAPEPAAADAAGAGGTGPTPEEAQPVASPPAPQPEPRPPASAPAAEDAGDITDGRHFIQAGVFDQPENAARLVEKLRAADLLAIELPLTLGERQLTRVLVGPYQTIAERDSALETVRKLGPADASPARG
jgi:cell division septation protein DedD